MPLQVPDHQFVGWRPRRCPDPDCRSVAASEIGESGLVFHCALCDLPANGRVHWSGICPVCRSTALVAVTSPRAPQPVVGSAPRSAKPAGGMECLACAAVFSPPPERAVEADLPSAFGHPRWEDDARLAEGFSRYARPGRLAEEWGAPGPLEREKSTHGGPAFWAQPGKRGRQDDLLEASRHADAEQVIGLADALRALCDVALRSGRKLVPAKTHGRGLRALLLRHTADVARQPMSGTGAATADFDAQPWFLEALGVLVANALLAREIDVWALLKSHRGAGADVPAGPIEPVATRLPRTTPFAGYHHALAVAFSGEATLGGRAAAPGGAMAKHALPQGVVFGAMSVAPSRSGSSRAQGEDEVGGRVFLLAALQRQGLDALDLTLLQLVDHGLDRGVAKRTRRGTIDEALEALDPAEAVAWLREHGQVVTEREVRKRLRRARETVTTALRAREQIPEKKRQPARSHAVAPLELPRFG